MNLLSATPLEGYKARLSYEEGKFVDVDLLPLFHGFKGVWKAHKDPSFFKEMYVEDGVLTWPNGTDIDPYTLHGLYLGYAILRLYGVPVSIGGQIITLYYSFFDWGVVFTHADLESLKRLDREETFTLGEVLEAALSNPQGFILDTLQGTIPEELFDRLEDADSRLFVRLLHDYLSKEEEREGE